ncbi:MAG: Rossmann-like domain-containing protein, partial [Gammaproteobacteria bacterium]
LQACRNASFVAMIGPSGGCLPDPLFARGVTVLGGSAVIDREGLVDAIERGESWGRFARKYCIERSRYPGFEALLRSALAGGHATHR